MVGLVLPSLFTSPQTHLDRRAGRPDSRGNPRPDSLPPETQRQRCLALRGPQNSAGHVRERLIQTIGFSPV